MRQLLPRWWGHSAPGAGILAGLTVLLFVAVLLALAGCRPSKAEVLPVAVVAWPTNPKPTCDILPVPAPVEVSSLDDPERERVFITHRQWQDFMLYQSQVRDFSMSVAQCLAKLAPGIQEKP